MNGLLATAHLPGATGTEALGAVRAGSGSALAQSPGTDALDSGGERSSFLTLLQLASVSLRQSGGLQLLAADAAAEAETSAKGDGDATDPNGLATAPFPEPGAGQAPRLAGARDAAGALGARAAEGPTGPAGPAPGPTPEGVEGRAPETDAAAAFARAATDSGREPARAPAEAEPAARPHARAAAAFSPAPEPPRLEGAEAARAAGGTPAPMEAGANDVARAVESQSPAPPQEGASAAAPSSAEAREPGAAREVRALPELPARNETEIVREVRMLAQSGGGRARIQLHPPQLGDVSLRVTVTEHAVSVSFVAEHGQIAELLSRHLPELRQVLQSVGVRADSLSLDARAATDEAASDGSGADAWPGASRDDAPRGARDGDGLAAAELPEAWPPLPRIAPNSLGTVDLTI